jgi:hypothetical protein
MSIKVKCLNCQVTRDIIHHSHCKDPIKVAKAWVRQHCGAKIQKTIFSKKICVCLDDLDGCGPRLNSIQVIGDEESLRSLLSSVRVQAEKRVLAEIAEMKEQQRQRQQQQRRKRKRR